MTASKLVLNAASSAGSATLDIDDVFSTYLVTGTGSAYSVNNGIDLSGEGGLVWIKGRNLAGYNHTLYDTERSGTLFSDATNAASDYASEIASYNNNGFTTVSSGAAYNNVNNTDYCSWTFRKAPKFFDVVTYTGNATAGRTISHNLGCDVGMILIKNTSGSSANWRVYHRGMNGGTNPEQYSMRLNQTNTEATDSGAFNNTAPTSTHFTVGVQATNESGLNYVAYLFAHNNSNGEFGPDSDQDIIKCGDFQTSGTGVASVNLGFEPQWLIVKAVNNAYNWEMYDIMRGWGQKRTDTLKANTNAQESTSTAEDGFTPTSTGFYTKNYWGNNVRMIYMAIRRGPLTEPEDATKFFQAHAYSGDGSTRKYNLNITPDMVINLNRGGVGDARAINSRLIGSGQEMYTDQTGTEYAAVAAGMQFDYTNAIEVQNYRDTNGSTYLNLCWKRAPGYFDIVAYTGNDTAGRTVTHNLGAVPEMMWVKRRDGADRPWYVYHKNLDTSNPAHKYLQLNETSGVADSTGFWNDTAPTSSVFTVGDDNGINGNTSKYIAYLFATVAGVSKVGSFTATGNTINVDCGFSNGAAFILMKRVDSTTFGWAVWDSTRGIVSGNDPYSLINDTSVEVTNTDYVDPLSSGFTVSNSFYSAGTWLFYAIAA